MCSVTVRPARPMAVVSGTSLGQIFTQFWALPQVWIPPSDVNASSRSMADIARRLARAHINVEYSYLTAPSPEIPTVVILRVSDIRKAQEALAD